jgi:diguanylate cyclase (GGDEF)-like protein
VHRRLLTRVPDLADLLKQDGHVSRRAVMIGAPLTVAVLAVVDHFTGPMISLGVFYLLPVAAVACTMPRAYSVAISTICAALWFLDGFPKIPTDLPLAVVAWMAAERVVFFLLVSFLLASLRDSTERQRQLADTDEMTGAANRRAFHAAASRELAQAAREPAPLSIAFIDLDNLKLVNDRLGHAAGDRALCTLVETVRMNIRAADQFARVGGDEFVLLLHNADEQAAAHVLDKLRAVVHSAMTDRGFPITCSVGLVTYYTPPSTVDELLAKADALQYRVKHEGKNSIIHEIVGTPVAATAEGTPATPWLVQGADNAPSDSARDADTRRAA